MNTDAYEEWMVILIGFGVAVFAMLLLLWL